MEMLGRGVYSMAEAAAYARLPYPTVYSWFNPDAKSGREPLFQSDLPDIDGGMALSFLDLVDVLVAGHLRTKKLPLQRIRVWYRALQEQWKLSHPFCHQRLRLDTGTRELFLELEAAEGLSDFAEVLSGQQYAKHVIEPFLSHIDYEEELARAWRIHRGIVIDPAVSFGKPAIEGRGITTHVVYNEFTANDRDADFVARLYGIPRERVQDAVDFEEHYRKAAA